jgi:hypothetical protein
MLSKQLWTASSTLFSRSVIEFAPGCPLRPNATHNRRQLGLSEQKGTGQLFFAGPVTVSEKWFQRRRER